jgi:hypothetical protein
MLNDIYTRFNRKVFYANHEAVMITQTNGKFVTEVRFVGPNDKQRPNLFFKSKNVILATGAMQST